MTAESDDKRGRGVPGRAMHESDLVTVAPKAPTAYERDSLAALTVYSLYWLHQWELRRTIEAIAVLNWRLFPAKFSMVGFPQFPDAFRTNRSLLQGQPKYRNWLTGSAKTGYNLNDLGTKAAEKLTVRLGPPLLSDGTSLGAHSIVPQADEHKPARTIDPSRVVGEIRRCKLFRKWASQIMSERDLIHVHALLGVFDHTPARIRLRKMKELQKCATDASDSEVGRFLEEVRQEFPSVFRA